MARRVIGTEPATRVVRLTVGLELTTKLAQTAWELTAKGPLDEAGVETLRNIALEHWFGTIDDNERLFIAALLDPGNAAKLHAAHPRDFAQEGSLIEFDAASITASNRHTVQDSDRSKRPAPDAFDKAVTRDPLKQDILAMGHPGFEYTVTQVLKFADQAHVDHVALYVS